MEKVLRVLDSSGDSVMKFEPGTKAEGEARKLFERLRSAGSQAFSVNRDGGQPDQKVTDFSALENETVIIPRIVGG